MICLIIGYLDYCQLRLGRLGGLSIYMPAGPRHWADIHFYPRRNTWVNYVKIFKKIGVCFLTKLI